MTRKRIGIIGCTGRMGQEIIASISRRDDAEYIGGTARNIPDNMKDEIFLDPSQLCGKADILIDFSLPDNAFRTLEAAKDVHIPVVCGVTGFSEEQMLRVRSYAKHIPLLYSANMSIGINILRALTRKTAGILDTNFDIDILEMHHKHKADAPSGTALALGEEAAAGRGSRLKDIACYAREGVIGPRPEGEIGFATLRGGSVPGDHSVLFAGEYEHITLSHSAKSRAIFADGAVLAACFLHGQCNGYYTMEDALHL